MTTRQEVKRRGQWPTGKRGAVPWRVVIAYDSAADQYYLDDDRTQAAAYIAYDSGDDQYTLDTAPGATNARVLAVPYFARVME